MSCVAGCYHVVVVFWCPEEELLVDDRSPHTSLLDVCQGDPSPSTHRRRDSNHHSGPGKGHTDLSTGVKISL